MAGVVKSMDSAMRSMNLEKVGFRFPPLYRPSVVVLLRDHGVFSKIQGPHGDQP